jgi:hypothetical protein
MRLVIEIQAVVDQLVEIDVLEIAEVAPAAGAWTAIAAGAWTAIAAGPAFRTPTAITLRPAFGTSATLALRFTFRSSALAWWPAFTRRAIFTRGALLTFGLPGLRHRTCGRRQRLVGHLGRQLRGEIRYGWFGGLFVCHKFAPLVFEKARPFERNKAFWF